MTESKKNIAIIGSGISGLTTAFLLHKKHNITVFEANDYIGGHTHTHVLNDGQKDLNVDSGFIVYNTNTYPNFIKLLDQLGVETQETIMSFSVKSEKSGLEYSGNSLNSLFSQRSNLFRPSFYRMIFSILRFNKLAKKTLGSLEPEVTLGEILERESFPNEFIDHYIVPMGAAIWSAIPTKVLDMPALFFFKFFQNHGLLQVTDRPKWRVIKGGSNQYIEKLTAGFKENIKLSTPVRSIKRISGGVEVELKNEVEKFDAVVLAVHSNQVIQLLSDISPLENEILRSLPYQPNEVVIHTDAKILPKRKLAWSSWNYLLTEDAQSPVSLTYNMNILQSLSSKKIFCVTLNNTEKTNPDKRIKNISYEHPIFTVEGIKNQKRKSEINGVNNTFFCGAYWRNGFHEDGVVSALDVGKLFGVSL